MREDEPLPVEIEHIRRDGARKLYARPARQRLDEKLYLRVVAQGLEVSHAEHGCGDGLAVDDAALAEADGKAEAV